MRWFRRTPIAATRWVAIDCETSGLDAARDPLLSVGAVAVSRGRIHLAAPFEARVRQQTPSTAANILIHGIGGEAQLAGAPLEDVLRDLNAYVGDAVPVGFHAPFDAAVLARHGFRPSSRWIDLAVLLPGLFPGRRAKLLEEWLGEFGIDAYERHDALADAFYTAQLLLVILAEAARHGIETVEGLRAAQGNRRWLA